MKKLNFFRFCTFMAVALFAGATMVSCGDDDPVNDDPNNNEQDKPGIEHKDPTVALTAGEAALDAITFTIATTEATELAYTVVAQDEAAPAAEELLANGNKLEAKASQEVTVNGLEAETTYAVYAAVTNEGGKKVLSAKLEMTTLTPEAPKEPKMWLTDNTGAESNSVEATSEGTTKQFLIYVENSEEIPVVVSDNKDVFNPAFYDTPNVDENHPDAVYYVMNVEVPVNRVEEERTGTITVTLGELTATITCRQEAYVAPLQQEGAATISFATAWSETTNFDAAGSVYTLGATDEFAGFEFTFFNNSGKFKYLVGFSGTCALNMYNNDAIKIDGKGLKINKVEWFSTNDYIHVSGLAVGDTTLTPGQEAIKGSSGGSTQYYTMVWEGEATDVLEFTAHCGKDNAVGEMYSDSFYPELVRITYIEVQE